jgi:hypothetical protein
MEECTMPDNETSSPTNKRTPWNKGKLIGARPPLRPKHVWSIRTRLLPVGKKPGKAVQLLLGHTKIESTVRYLGIEAAALCRIAVEPNGW